MKGSTFSHCDRCRGLFDSKLAGTWVQIEGWVIVRGQGGANAVRDKHETGRVLCPKCGKERVLGIIPGQELLFN